MPQINRQLVLASRPQGAVTPDNFKLVETPTPPSLRVKEYRILNRHYSFLNRNNRRWAYDTTGIYSIQWPFWNGCA